MLSKKRRLPYAEFQTRGYTTQRTPFFTLKARANEGYGPRIGVIAGKSVHKTATKRNFWKRTARDVVTPLVRGDRDVIIVLQARANELSKRAFQEALIKTTKSLL